MPSPAFQDLIASVGGEVTFLREARIAVADHGFLYGDSIYETMRSFRGQVFRWADHLQRLRNSAAGLFLTVPWSDEDLTTRLETFRGHLPQGEHYLRLIVTRGSGPLSYWADEQPPQLILIGGPLPVETTANMPCVRIVLCERRRNPRQSLDPSLKTGNLLNPRLAAMEARRRGVEDAVLLNIDGHLSEATTSNLFFVKDGELRTPHADCGLLGGITRRVVLEVAAQLGLPVQEGFFSGQDLLDADEIFLTSTTRSLGPVREIEGRAKAAPGPVTLRLMEAFESAHGGL